MSETTQIKLGFFGWLRWGWRQLTTMRVALWLLVLLGVAAIPGSLFPQQNTSPGLVAEYKKNNPDLAVWVERFDGFDVYGSVWFSGIYLLLMISLIGCIIPRLKLHIRAWRTPPQAPPADFTKADVRFLVRKDLSDAELIQLLPIKRWRKKAYENGFSAEAGLLRETGNLAFHISLLAILVAVALGSGYGYRGQVILREGVSFSNVLAQYDSFNAGSQFSTDDLRPFNVLLDELEVDWVVDGPTTGAPADFRAFVTYRESADDEIQTMVVGVNNPLNVGNASLFLIGHGYAPHIRVTNPEGQVLFDDTVIFLPKDGNFTSVGVVKIPDVEPQIGLDAIFAPTGVVEEMIGPHSVFPALVDPVLYSSAWVGDLGMDTGVAQNVYLLDKTKMENIGIEELRPGDTWELPDGNVTVEFVGVEQFATFNIASDPGQNWALLAAVLTILGVIAALYIQRGYLWARRNEAGEWEIAIVGKEVEKYVTKLESNLAQAGIEFENTATTAPTPQGENS